MGGGRKNHENHTAAAAGRKSKNRIHISSRDKTHSSLRESCLGRGLRKWTGETVWSGDVRRRKSLVGPKTSLGDDIRSL